MQLHLQDVPARNGKLWIRHGFKVFQRQPIALAGLFGLFLLMTVVMMLVPVIGVVLLMMALPMLSLGFMLATHLVLQRKTPTVSVFLAPFQLTQERRRSQLLLCLSYGAAALLIMWLSDWADGDATRELQELIARSADSEAIAQAASDPRIFWGLGIRLGLASLLSIPYWHAPALVHWGGQGVGQALFSSTLALWRNKGAFALNIVLWGALLFASASALSLVFAALGLAQQASIVLVPLGMMFSTVFYASLYFSFVDCFMFGAPKDLLDEQA
jgi:hypothetical protein